ncbi:MAG: Gfo/Idh/MocA family oxidoreductase [Sedimentisphaerales bacterium]|nr:Gfo/Idh/MocA family oxidoreductase [Sedimentisphaerales bacterium]
MSGKVKWGVVGSGGIARRRTIPEGIIPADNAVLVVVYDINGEVNTEVSQEYHAQKADSIEELLKTDIDAVYIATPANLHCEQVLTCARAGKHVLCEKPLGMTVDEAEKMITACKNAGVILDMAFMMRFHAQHQAALKMIQEGRLGELTYGRAQLSCWYPPMEGAWRQDPATGGGGSLMDMGGHCIDLMEMFFGKIAKVSCLINNTVHKYPSEDSAVATLSFENGALATVDNFFCIPDNSSKNVLELYGSHGSILAKNTVNQGDRGEMVACLEAADSGYNAQQTRADAQEMVIDPEPVNTYRAEIEQFGQAILEGRQPSCGSQAGLRSQKVLAACYESAKTGRVIDICWKKRGH